MDEARPYWADPSQEVMGSTADTLPDEGCEYWADGPVCGVFHLAPWPDVWMGHYGVIPSERGRLVAPAKRVLAAFWSAHSPQLIIGWTDIGNRAALAFARRLGFTVTGEMSNGVVMTEWRP